MLLYPFPALATPFSRTFIVKGNINNGRNPVSFPFPALVTTFPDIAVINEEATRCIYEKAICAINEATIGAIIVPQNLSSCFFLNSCFTVPVTPLFNRF